MQLVEGLDSGSIARLGRQHGLLLRIHQADLAENPASHATKSSRSNLMHTVNEMYGEAFARNVVNLVVLNAPMCEPTP
jgi:hypothetical protein